MKDITKDYTVEHRRSIRNQNRKTRISSCEQCFGTSFRKEPGKIICNKCGQVYWV